jgi:hypothetical protein
MSRTLRLCAALVVAMLLLAGCGSKDSGGSGDSGAKATTKKSAGGGIVIDITFKGDQVTPQGASIKATAGKPITLHIVADKPGELHVHSSPEHEFEYKAGTTDETFTIKQPGVVEMESHTLDKLVAQLEVR